MKYIVESKKTIEQVSEDLTQAVSDNGFGVLHVQNLKETMNNKGVEFENECKIFEVCNPHKAKEIMSADMSMNIALPCRISVFKEDDKTFIAMVKPKALLLQLSDSKPLLESATVVEETLLKIINQAV